MTEVRAFHEEFDETQFQLVAELGQGVYAHVNLYWSESVGFRCVKCMHNDVFSQMKGPSWIYFDREVQILSSIQHPAAIRLYAYGKPGEDDPPFDPWIEMEFIPGGTLSEYLASRVNSTYTACLNAHETVIILYGVASVLNAIHQRNIIHRDVKSENVFLDGEGKPHLGDFGFSRELDSMMTSGVYSMDHAAPELLKNQDIGLPADVWAFGMLIYEIRKGLPPYWTPGSHIPTSDEVREWIVQGINPPKLENDPFSALFRWCTNQDPAKRPTMSQCLQWIERGVTSGEIVGVDIDKFKQYQIELTKPYGPAQPLTIQRLSEFAKSPDGSGDCSFIMGQMYYEGIGVPRDIELATGFFRAAAEKKHFAALERLISLVDNGEINISNQERIMFQDAYLVLSTNREYLSASQSQRLSCLSASEFWPTTETP